MPAVKKFVYLSLAALLTLVGLAGIFLPVLPCTPFLLLASILLLRVSPTWHARLLNSKLFGPILRDWHEHRGIRRAVRRRAIAMVVLAIAATLLLVGPSFALGLVMLVGGAIGVAVILRIPLIDADNSAAFRVTAELEAEVE